MVSRFRAGARITDPRDTTAWRALRRQVFGEETHCWQCGMWVDQNLPRTHPMSRTVDHMVPVARGGDGVPSRSGVRLCHRKCNSRRGHRPERVRGEMSIDPALI